MSNVINTVGPLLVVVALVVPALVLVATRSAAASLPILLDLLLVAGLLRLSAVATWEAIASAALIVVIRKVVTAGLSVAQAARRAPAPPPWSR